MLEQRFDQAPGSGRADRPARRKRRPQRLDVFRRVAVILVETFVAGAPDLVTRMTELKVRIRRPASGPVAGRRGTAAWAVRTWPMGPGKQAPREAKPAVLMIVRRFMVFD
jgi:hypothetical protein